MNKSQYEIEPEDYWQEWRDEGNDGYDIMELAELLGWHAISSWGAHGWDLGSWPYVIVFARKLDLLVWVEGDLTRYHFPDIATRNAAIDDIAFFYWKHANEDWVAGIHEAEYAPQYLRGPYTGKRGDEHDVRGERMYVCLKTHFLHECALVFEGKGALRYVQVGRNVYRGTLRTNRTDLLGLQTSKGVKPSHYVDVPDLDAYGPGC